MEFYNPATINNYKTLEECKQYLNKFFKIIYDDDENNDFKYLILRGNKYVDITKNKIEALFSKIDIAKRYELIQWFFNVNDNLLFPEQVETIKVEEVKKIEKKTEAMIDYEAIATTLINNLKKEVRKGEKIIYDFNFKDEEVDDEKREYYEQSAFVNNDNDNLDDEYEHEEKFNIEIEDTEDEEYYEQMREKYKIEF